MKKISQEDKDTALRYFLWDHIKQSGHVTNCQGCEYVDALDDWLNINQTKQTIQTKQPIQVNKSCNRHNDCSAATTECCIDEDCPDCFGY